MPLGGAGGSSLRGGAGAGGGAATGGTAGSPFAGAAGGLGGGAGGSNTQPLEGGGTLQALPLSTNDLVFDPKRGVLYASRNPTGGAPGNSVITLDPISGTVTHELPVGGLPSVLAISDDASAVYVGVGTLDPPLSATAQVDGADSVRRIDLAAMTAGPPVSLGRDSLRPYTVAQMAAVPGSSTQVLVSRRHPGLTPEYAGLAVYEGSTLVTELSSYATSGDSIAFVDQATLIGCSNFQSPSELMKFSLTSTAIKPGKTLRDVIVGGSRTRIAADGGWIFASDGHAVSAATMESLGRYADPQVGSYLTIAPAPEPGGSNVWFLGYVGTSRTMALVAFDRTTFQLRRTISLGDLPDPWDFGNIPALVRWSGGFAFRTFHTLYIIKLPA
jgi:hypothetical protein